MPAKDIYHDVVKAALIRDNWEITDDPLTLRIGGRSAMVDLGAEKLIAATKGTQKIAVEIKSFIGKSPLNDLENALGQYLLYSRILQKKEPDRVIYLAIADTAYKTIFAEEIGELLLENNDLKLLVFNPNRREIIKWID